MDRLSCHPRFIKIVSIWNVKKQFYPIYCSDVRDQLHIIHFGVNNYITTYVVGLVVGSLIYTRVGIKFVSWIAILFIFNHLFMIGAFQNSFDIIWIDINRNIIVDLRNF